MVTMKNLQIAVISAKEFATAFSLMAEAFRITTKNVEMFSRTKTRLEKNRSKYHN